VRITSDNRLLLIEEVKLRTMKVEQERLKRLLKETVRVFINDSVKCHNAICVEGLIRVTLDNEVFLVYVNESSTDGVGGVAANSDSCSGVVTDDSNINWLVEKLGAAVNVEF
jgi:hypothetical protein